MKKGRAIIGLPIFLLNEGQRLGKVMDILYAENHGHGEIMGIVVEVESAALPEMRFIHMENIAQLNEEAVFIENKELLQAPQCLKNIQKTSYSTALLFGQNIYNEMGKEKGTVKDVILNLEDKKVEGYQVSNGFISDLVSGRDIIPVGNVITMSKDMIIVKDQ